MTTERLKREVSLFGAVSILVGYVIGASIYILVGPLSGLAGSYLWLSYLIAATPGVFVVLYSIMLAGCFPATGAKYVAATRVFSPFAGYLVGWMVIIGTFFGVPLLAWGFAAFLNYFVKVPTILVAMGILTFFFIVNYFGIKISSWAQALMTIVFIVGLLIFGFGCLPYINPQLQSLPLPMGAQGIVMAALPAYYSYIGLSVVLEIAGEVKNPRRTLPRAIIIGFGIILFIYILVTYVLTGVMSWEEASKSSAAVVQAAAKYLPSYLAWFIGISGLFAAATTINGVMLTSSRDFLMLGKDKILPSFAGKINRYGAPAGALLLIYVISMLGTLIALAIEEYSLLTVYAIMVIEIMGATTLLLIPKRKQELLRKSTIPILGFWRWFACIGAVIVGLFYIIFGMTTYSWTVNILFWILVVIGLFYWFIRKTYLSKKGFNLTEELKKLPEITTEELEA